VSCSGFTLGWNLPLHLHQNLLRFRFSRCDCCFRPNLAIKTAFRFLLRLQISLGFSYNLRSMLCRISACWLHQSQTLGFSSFRLYYSSGVRTWKICLSCIPFSENGQSDPAVNTQPLIFLIPVFTASGLLIVISFPYSESVKLPWLLSE
jgi:hypothetical protein